MKKVNPIILKQIKKVTGKRPLTVINHILKHGHITSEELKDKYGYHHPPRAIRDVRECGIPLDMHWVDGSGGRKIGDYTFGDPNKVERHKLGGRKVFSKAFKKRLIEKQGSVCALTGEPYQSRYLSIDHRIPYEVAGDRVSAEGQLDSFMLISAAAQRQKSWSCEHCDNWSGKKDIEICRKCYWASPKQYEHISLEQRRRLDVHWIGKEETATFQKALSEFDGSLENLRDYIKTVLRQL